MADHHRSLRPRHLAASALARLASLLLATALACRQGSDRVLIRGDAVLLAPDRQVLVQRLELVEDGRYGEAHGLWAERALLPPLPSALDSGEMAWNRHLTAALETEAVKGSDPRALDRLARAFDRARWYREAHAVLEEERDRAPLGEESQRLLAVTRNLSAFATAVDSLARARYAGSGESGAGGGGAGSAEAEVGAKLRKLLARFGLTVEALQARGIYLGVRPVAGRPRRDEIQLAVVVRHDGPFTVRHGEAAVVARRIVLDDNIISPHPERVSPWHPGSVVLVEDGTVVAYHDRSVLRRAATLLYLELERRGGRAPETIEQVGESPLAGGLPGRPAGLASSPVSSPADADPGASGDERVSRTALALRLKSVSPLFERARADGGPRPEVLRRFVLDVIAARIAQVETGMARRLVAERAQPGTTDGAPGSRLELLGSVGWAPLPGLRLADVLEAADRSAAGDAEGEAARAIVEQFRRRLGGSHEGWPAALLELSDERLKAIAAAIAGDEPW